MARFIVLEGLDGSGKGTQTKLLADRMEKEGYKVCTLDFPNYSTEGCTLVEMYLGGKLGDNPSDTNAYAASVFFASDRYVSYVTSWKEDYADGNTVIVANRYTTANAYHQISKMPENEWDAFLDWLWDFEFDKLGLPRPDKVILLDMPESVSSAMVRHRSEETGAVLDIHEKDEDYLVRCRRAAKYVADKCAWTVINCASADGSALRTREEIAEDVFRAAMEDA